MALNDLGFPVIAFFEDEDDDLNLAVCQDATCSLPATVTSIDTASNAGELLSLELNAGGFPVISYLSGNSVKLAVCADAECDSVDFPPTISTIATDASWPSLELNSSQFPVIAYVTLSADLVVAECHDLTCDAEPTRTTIDDGPNDDISAPSLDLTTSDAPVVAYQQRTGISGELRLAGCVDAGCTTLLAPDTIDAPASAGQSTSMVLNDADGPVISYGTGSSSQLKVATCPDLACADPALVVLDDVTVRNTSIALNLSGFPVVSYYDDDLSRLEVAVCADATCGASSQPNRTLTVVDGGFGAGLYNSLAIDGSGNPVISASDMYWDVTLHYVPATTASVDVYAGADTTGTPLLPIDPPGTGPMANQAHLGWPTDMAFDVDGNMYFTDRYSHAVRRIDADGTQVFSVAGRPGERCADPTTSCGDGGLAFDAHLRSPWGIALDDETPQNIYVSDYGNHKIRRIDGSDGTISTIAGTGTAGLDSNPLAVASQLNFPSGLTVDGAGDVLVADRGNHRIRKIVTTGPASAWTVTTFLGSGGAPGFTGPCDTQGTRPSCNLNQPTDIEVRATSDLPSVASTTDFFITDRAINTVLVTRDGSGEGAGIIAEHIGSGTAGHNDGPAASAMFDQPLGLAYDALHEELYIADSHNLRVRRYSLVNLHVTTVAGNGQGKFGTGAYVPPADGEALLTAINFPIGVAFRPTGTQSQGTAFYSGVYENQIRELTMVESGLG